MTGYRFAAAAASLREPLRRCIRGCTTRRFGDSHRPPGIGLPTPALAVVCLTAATAVFAQNPSGAPTDAEILALVKTHCVQCHAAEPTHEAFARAPAGVLLETIAQISANAPRVFTQVAVTRAMPLGNETGMTDQERARLAAWIESRAK